MQTGKVVKLMRNAIKAKGNGSDLIKVLQSEITHELSNPRFQNDLVIPPGDFSLEWDAPHSKDTVLQKKWDTGEEVSVSALLGPYTGDTTYPRVVRMKVCIKKPGFGSSLLFDIDASSVTDTSPDIYITRARYLRTTDPKEYTGPLFRDLDPTLQLAFKDYLEARGVGQSLTNYLLLHMHRKEQNQYINWLQKLQEMLSKGELLCPS